MRSILFAGCVVALVSAGCVSETGDGVSDGLTNCPTNDEFCAADLPTTPDEPGDDSPDEPDVPDEPGDSDDDIDLPYDIKMALGETYTPIIDAFLEKGRVPDEIIEVDLDGSEWRAAELLNHEAFEITEDDCNHEGNKATGRDRIFVTWRTADGGTETDHLDLRYCE